MSDLYVCVYKHARLGSLGAYSPRKFLEIEIASEPISRQKQSRSSYRVVFHTVFGCQCMHLLSQLTINSTREGTKFGRTTGEVASLEGQHSSA